MEKGRKVRNVYGVYEIKKGRKGERFGNTKTHKALDVLIVICYPIGTVHKVLNVLAKQPPPTRFALVDR